MKRFMLCLLLIGGFLLLSPAVHAGPVTQYTIVIKNHQFDPATLTVPAGEKIKLTVDNQDATPEEFESYDLNREKMVGANKQIVIFIGPLKPGAYQFFGEFHQETAQGTVVAE